MGRRAVEWNDFKTSYTGVYLRIIPKEKFQPAGRRYNVFKAIAEKLLQDKWATLFVMILGLCMVVTGLANPVFSQIFLDEILTNKHPE